MFIKTNNTKMYRNILISFVSVISISILIISFILYFNFEKIVMNQNYSNKVSNLKQNGEEVYNMKTSVAKLATLVRQDVTIIGLLYNRDPQAEDFIPTLKQLKNYKDSNEFVDSLYVYNNITKTFYAITDYSDNIVKEKNSFYDKDAINIINNINNYKVLYPVPRKLQVSDLVTGEKTEKFFYTFVYFDKLQKEPDNVVLVNVDQNRIGQFLKKGDENSKSNTIIMDKSGKIISNNDKYPIFTDTSKEKFTEKILASKEDKGYLIEDVKGVKSFITYAEADNNMDWIYVSITPYKEIVRNINKMKYQTIFFSLVILLLGIFISYFTSKKIYVPIGKMVKELGNYELEKENSLYNMKNDFLKNLLFDPSKYDVEYIKEKFKEYKIGFHQNLKLSMVDLTVDEFSQYIIKHNEEDIKLLHYGISNIVNEIAATTTEVHSASIKNNEMIILICNENKELALEGFLYEIRTKVKELLKVSITLTFTNKESDICNLNVLYKKLNEASYNRLIYGSGSLINADTIEELNQKEYEYPIEKEKNMINSLVFGNVEEAKKIYTEIIEDSMEYSYKAINMCIFHIIFDLDKVIHNIKKNNIVNIDFNVNSFIEIFKNAESMKEINDAFNTMVENICSIINDKKKHKHKDLIDKIIEFINEDFKNQDLSIEKIADNFAMNATYIGRLFKSYTQKGINELINEVRINKAKELLQDEKNSIEGISQKCGFSNISYFYKIFKNVNGTTPNEYRKNAISEQIASFK